jgi:hypothetical protein
MQCGRRYAIRPPVGPSRGAPTDSGIRSRRIVAAVCDRGLSRAAGLTEASYRDLVRQNPLARPEQAEGAMFRAIAKQQVGGQFGRVEPRANKRRPKAQRSMTEPRSNARKRL